MRNVSIIKIFRLMFHKQGENEEEASQENIWQGISKVPIIQFEISSGNSESNEPSNVESNQILSNPPPSLPFSLSLSHTLC